MNETHKLQQQDARHTTGRLGAVGFTVTSLSGSGGDRERERERQRDRDRETHQGLVCRLSLAVGAR